MQNMNNYGGNGDKKITQARVPHARLSKISKFSRSSGEGGGRLVSAAVGKCS